MKKIIFIIVILILPVTVNAARGCCSHHGGVSHCGPSGKYICNDGTTSPSCTCTYYGNSNSSSSTKKESTTSNDTKSSSSSNSTQSSQKSDNSSNSSTNSQTTNKNSTSTNMSTITNIQEETKEEESDSDAMLGLLTLAVPGSIAAIAYERKIRR